MKKRIIFTFIMVIGTISVSGLLAESLMRLFYDPTSILNLDEIEDNPGKYLHTPPRNDMGFREDDLSIEVFQVKRLLPVDKPQYVFAIFCKERGIEFHLIIFPLLFGLESDYQFFDVEKEISCFAEENGIPVFSLIDGFIGQESKSLWVSPSDQHPNEKGHLVAADTLYPYLREVLKH